MYHMYTYVSHLYLCVLELSANVVVHTLISFIRCDLDGKSTAPIQAHQVCADYMQCMYTYNHAS